MKKKLLIVFVVLGFAFVTYAAWDGATNYPGALDDSASLYDVEDDSTVEDEHHDAPVQAIIAIETKIGTGASTPADNQVLTGTGAGTSAWGAVDVSTDVTGTLNVENGGTEVAAITDHCVIVGSGTAAVTILGVGAAKEVLKGVTGADPDFVTERAFSKQNYTANGNITEAYILASKYHSNQGDAGEADLVLPDLAYPVTIIILIEEAQNIEINPPAGEYLDLDGTDLDPDDCVDSDSTVGSTIALTNGQDADGDWIWRLNTIRGAWVDTGASD